MSFLTKILLAILSGVCFGLGWPETGGLTPLLFVAFVPLLMLQEDAQKNKTNLFGYSFLSFTIWHMISASWVYCVNEDFITKLISLVSITMLNSCFMAIIFQWSHAAMKKLKHAARYLAFISIWISFEYLHLHWDMSYPWLNLGNGLANNIQLIQWYEYTGTFGGTLWILLVNLTLFLAIKSYIENKVISKKYSIYLTILLVFPIATSLIVWNNYEEAKDPIEVVIVQPNIDPYYEKFSGLTPEEQLIKLVSLGDSLVTNETDYLLGPETAIPQSIVIDRIQELSPWKILKDYQKKHTNINLILGASLTHIYNPGEKIPISARKFRSVDRWYDHFNSAIQIDNTDTPQVYHKSKLVLAVEMMPFPSFFAHFQKLIFDLGGVTGTLGTQEERDVFISENKKVKVAPVICYESVYGEYCTDYVKKGANVIFILTNDGWWDDSPGYHQHYTYAKLRAIETRRSIARSANTGTSGFINQRGESFDETDYWVEAAIKKSINLNNSITVYVMYGDYIARLASFMAAVLLLWTIVKHFTKEELSLK